MQFAQRHDVDYRVFTRLHQLVCASDAGKASVTRPRPNNPGDADTGSHHRWFAVAGALVAFSETVEPQLMLWQRPGISREVWIVVAKAAISFARDPLAFLSPCGPSMRVVTLSAAL